MLNNLPKPVVYGVALIAVILAVFMIFRTVSGKSGENADRPSKDEIRDAQKNAAGQPGGGRSQTGGH